MILSLIDYGNTVYAGTTNKNLDKLDKLFYRGLRIYDGTNTVMSRVRLCNDCHIDTFFSFFFFFFFQKTSSGNP